MEVGVVSFRLKKAGSCKVLSTATAPTCSSLPTLLGSRNCSGIERDGRLVRSTSPVQSDSWEQVRTEIGPSLPGCC